jgi:hypothetical protein
MSTQTLYVIFEYFGVGELAALSMTSKLWNRIARRVQIHRDTRKKLRDFWWNEVDVFKKRCDVCDYVYKPFWFEFANRYNMSVCCFACNPLRISPGIGTISIHTAF